MPTADTVNENAAHIFTECADVLRLQKANPFRVNAYLRAARTLRSLEADVRDILEDEGIEGLMKLPGIGKGLAAAIDEIARTGRLSQFDRLRGESSPEALFQSLPGIGPGLAHTIHETLHVDTLEALEVAAHDGRLDDIPGIGSRRAAAIRAGLADILRRGRRYQQTAYAAPSVATLLAIDERYRRLAAAGKLPKIAPKRFNPEGRAWLPVMHTNRGKWHFTALFSNTARAHELGRTDDWVVIYYYDGDHEEGQNTVVTETHGPRQG
ncbi:MAG: DNA-binding protein, partial [Woeseiaceae bacterium]|nr:DNA-binding protein [Woeseiaceae bacterium]NNL64355.1 DNA-binding protein [Woeseiaceae bacterium]